MELLTRVESVFGGAYEIERELPGGGMSRLFIATDRELQRKVVIKILPPELTSDMMTARFRRESEVTARLQHPHILPVISAGMRDGLLYYVMPFIEGESLRGRLDREGQLPVRDAVRLLWEVADALSYAHKLGIVHRDIKPENILIQDGHAVLADFGIAAALAGPDGESIAERLTRTGMSLGTVGYMSPEQSFGERDLDGRSDIYVLGVVAHEMLAGAPPFTGTTAQAVMTAHITDEPPRLDDLRDDVPDGVVAAIARALRKTPGERFQTAAELRDALDAPETTRVDFTRAFRLRKLRKHRGPVAVGVAGALLAVVAGVWGFREWRARSGPVEYVTIAVAPFNALGPDLEFWREGLVDLMTRNLDGAGPLRTVSPLIAIRDFPVRGTLNDARALASRTRSRYAILGTVSGFGSEGKFRLSGSLVDMETGKVSAFEKTGASVEAAADSVTLEVLTQLGKNHRIAATARSQMGSTSIPALRAFLQGEQFYRRTSWDSAAVVYGKAIALDTGFALALRRAADVASWINTGSDSIARAHWLRAGTHNRGLSPRDSLLVSADSLRAALSTMSLDSLDWSAARRLFATVNEAAARYPDDPEVWYVVGEARFHHGYGSLVHTTERGVLDAFDRAIALDSSFAPAYVHAIELAFTLDGEGKGRRYARSYLTHDPTDEAAEGIRLLDRMLALGGRQGNALDALADSASPTVLYKAWTPIRRWPDSTETALRLLRSYARRLPGTGALASPSDSARLRRALALQLAYDGRMREAYLVHGSSASRLVPELALYGAVPADSAMAIFTRWQAAGVSQAYSFMPWLAQRRELAGLQALRSQAVRAEQVGTRAARRTASYNAAAAAAYLTLARGDSSGALRSFLALPDTLCLTCYLDRWSTARLLIAAGRHAEARRILEQRLYTFMTHIEISMLADQGQVSVALGDRAAATRSFSRVIGAWTNGDPETQPVVAQVRRRMAALRSK